MIGKLSSDKMFSLLLIWFWSRDHICRYIRSIFMRLPYMNVARDWLIPIVTITLILLSLGYLTKRIGSRDMIFLLVAAVVYCGSMLLFPKTADYLTSISGSFWTSVLPIYFLGVAIEPQKHLPILYYTSIVNLIAFFAYSSLFGDNMSEMQAAYQGSMGRAYMLLPHIAMIAIYTIDKFNAARFVVFLGLFLYLIMCGTRGAVLCLVIFLAVYLFAFRTVKKSIWFYIVLFTVFALLILFYKQILQGLITLSASVGMSSRVLKLLDTDFLQSSGRDVITQRLLHYVKESPFIGYGVSGDVSLIGTYSHNLLIEFFVSYGVVVGTGLFAYLIYIVLKGYKDARDIEGRKLIVLFFCTIVIKLLLSSSYLLEELFFLLIGLCVGQIRGKRTMRSF